MQSRITGKKIIYCLRRRRTHPCATSGNGRTLVHIKGGRVHGLEHAHEFKCCFIARARCSEYASNIIS